MKEELIRRYMEKGKLLAPDILEKLARGELNENLLETDGVVVSTFSRERVKIIRNVSSWKKEASPDDFARFYRSRYEKMSQILQAKLQKDFVSLNKADLYRNEIYVIVMVRDIHNKDGKTILDVEDLTGQAKVIFDNEQDVDTEDTVAIKCISAGNILYGKQIIHPDVPLRPPKTGIGSAIFLSALDFNEAAYKDAEKLFSWLAGQPIDIVFVSGSIGDPVAFENYTYSCPEKTFVVVPGHKDSDEYPSMPIKFDSKNIISLSNPAIVEANGLVVLISNKFSPEMLRKRHLGKTKRVFDDDPLVLDVVPDIVCFSSKDPQILNYKSITIVSSGSLLSTFRPIIVNFQTREVVQADL